jgi:GGDEF domain-containing protein
MHMSAQNQQIEWPGGSIPNFLVSDEGGRLDRMYPRLQAEEPRFSATIQRIAASAQLGMNRRMKDPAHAARLIGPAQLRHVAVWHLMFDLLVELGQQAVAEGVCTAAASLAIHRSRAIGRDMLKDYQAVTVGFAARLGHWQLLDGEKDTVIGSLLDRLPPDRVEAMQRQIFQQTSSDIRAEKVKNWNLSPSLSDAANPPPNSQLANLQMMAVSLVANPRADQVTQDARRLAQVLGDCMNLGGDPWLPPPNPSPREILRKFASLKKSILTHGQTIEAKDTQMAALKSQLAAVDMEVAGLRNPSETLSELDREIKRSKRHKHSMAAICIAIDTRKGDTGDIVNQMHLLSTVINPHCRSEDLMGLIDAKSLAIFLPETGLDAGRIFAERIRSEIRSGFGLPPVLVYLTALEKEGDINAQSFGVSLSRAMEKMVTDENGPNFAFNTTGAISWR